MIPLPWISLLWALTPLAAAWETDQLSGRGQPLPDLTVVADARMQAVIDQAIERVNRQTGCEGSDAELHHQLARAIHAAVGRPDFVEGRGVLRGRGYNAYGAWVEELAQVDWLPPGEHLYADLSLWQAPLLRSAGVCSTVRLAGQRVGVDKLDHFLGMGFFYWLHSDRGHDPEAAMAWGTRTERSLYGMSTSLAFSFADLAANLDGYRFYAGLLEPPSAARQEPASAARREADGCLAPASPFTWADWIDWRYDEVYNPPVYAPAAARAVRRRLEADRERVCADYAEWGGPAYQAHLERVLKTPDPAVRGLAPARIDPYGLSSLCDEGSPSTGPMARSSSLRRRAQVRVGSTRSTRS